MEKGKLKADIMTSDDINRALIRISHQIIEKNHGTKNLCLIGIKTRGVPIAKRIAAIIKTIENVEIPVGALDITSYRDDLTKISEDPILNSSEILFSLDKMKVVLVDDVIFTSRTVRAALDAVMSLGRPDRIYLAVLIDRGHSELPIKPTFVGKNIPTAYDEIVAVSLTETDGENKVSLYEYK
ncbi:MAG TPA: bifunctional pyr operon transcriptional regulator/uracil phosphoribosyltransferase PyrR [Clostridia bacterium]|nr:bifunctional pyr operon transcriptional regulator/uracil phosphoribosyltransferase PyrR [Clostridia bacterium]